VLHAGLSALHASVALEWQADGLPIRLTLARSYGELHSYGELEFWQADGLPIRLTLARSYGELVVYVALVALCTPLCHITSSSFWASSWAWGEADWLHSV
jgi:hypothetical protein